MIPTLDGEEYLKVFGPRPFDANKTKKKPILSGQYPKGVNTVLVLHIHNSNPPRPSPANHNLFSTLNGIHPKTTYKVLETIRKADDASAQKAPQH